MKKEPEPKAEPKNHNLNGKKDKKKKKKQPNKNPYAAEDSDEGFEQMEGGDNDAQASTTTNDQPSQDQIQSQQLP